MSLYQTKVEQGRLEGIDKGNYAVYWGIPYAEPPVGPLRFCAPRKPEKWSDIRYAKTKPPISWQIVQPEDSFYEKEFYREDNSFLKRSEDCLYLNIWTPAKSCKDRLPVMFWIHGGAFKQGFAHEKEFEGEEYCRRGIILVTIQYRLGILGHLVHPWLENGDMSLAMQDQLAALDWIYKNIGNFGGDAKRITVAGQSAGAVSVQALLCADLSKGQIHQVIMQSGGGYGRVRKRCQTKAAALNSGRKFVYSLSVSNLQELQEMDAELLMRRAEEWEFPYFLMYESDSEEDNEKLQPDNKGELVSGVEAMLYQHSASRVHCLLGSNRNDLYVTQEMLKNGIPSSLYVDNIEFAKHYGDRDNCYLYFFQRQLPGDDAGAFHSAELWYMFGTLDRCWRPFREEDYDLSRVMLDAWCRFVKTGRPGSCEEEWSAYGQESNYIHTLG